MFWEFHTSTVAHTNQLFHSHTKLPIQARLKRKRPGNIGSACHRSPVLTHSLARRTIYSAIDTISNETAMPEFQENSLFASNRTVTRSSEAPNRRRAPPKSNLQRECQDIRSLSEGATYDFLALMRKAWWYADEEQKYGGHPGRNAGSIQLGFPTR